MYIKKLLEQPLQIGMIAVCTYKDGNISGVITAIRDKTFTIDIGGRRLSRSPNQLLQVLDKENLNIDINKIIMNKDFDYSKYPLKKNHIITLIRTRLDFKYWEYAIGPYEISNLCTYSPTFDYTKYDLTENDIIQLCIKRPDFKYWEYDLTQREIYALCQYNKNFDFSKYITKKQYDEIYKHEFVFEEQYMRSFEKEKILYGMD